MNDILIDIIPPKKNKQAIFTKIAFYFSVLTIALLTILFVNIALILKARGGNPNSSELIGGLAFCSMILGLTFTIVSLIRKEKIKYLKIVSASINIGLFVIIVGMMIFALVMDFKRTHN